MDPNLSPFVSIDIFENSGTIEILLHMLKYPNGIMRVEYRTTLSLSPPTATRAHELLFNAGLIENKPSKDTLLFGLTEDGLVIAQKFLEIEEVLNKINISHNWFTVGNFDIPTGSQANDKLNAKKSALEKGKKEKN
jgi:predicted transcriptional regulator